MELVTPNGRIGTPHWRVEDLAKVTVKALYGADQQPLMEHGYMAHAVAPLKVGRIFFADQIVAMVIAETAEIAEQAASAVEIAYAANVPSGTMDSAGAKVVKPKSLGEIELSSGNVEKGFNKQPSASTPGTRLRHSTTTPSNSSKPPAPGGRASTATRNSWFGSPHRTRAASSTASRSSWA